MSEAILEYATHAPEGTRCIRCGYRVESDQMVTKLVPLGEGVAFRHLQYSQCRSSAGRRLVELRSSYKGN